MASAQKRPRTGVLENPADDPSVPVAHRTRSRTMKGDTLDDHHTSGSPDWFRVFGGPTLAVILSHLDKRSTCNLRLTCRMLGGLDSLKDKCFGVLRLRIRRHPENDELYYYQRKESTYIRLDDQVSFEALGRLAPFVKEMFIAKIDTHRLTGDQELALIHPLPRFPNAWRLDWRWGWKCCGNDPNPETLLTLARLTPAVVQVSLGLEWALIPGPFHAQLLSLWPQLNDVRVRGGMDERLCGRQADPYTLLNAAASNELLNELDLWFLHRSRGFDLSALFHNNRTSLRVLGICNGIVSVRDLTALTRLDTLEKLTLYFTSDQSGNNIVSRDFLMALASVTTLKELRLTSNLLKVWNCTAMDLVHLFRDAQFSLRVLELGGCPFTAALPHAIAHTQKDLEDVKFWRHDFAEGEPRTVNIGVLEGLPKMKNVECTPW